MKGGVTILLDIDKKLTGDELAVQKKRPDEIKRIKIKRNILS